MRRLPFLASLDAASALWSRANATCAFPYPRATTQCRHGQRVDLHLASFFGKRTTTFAKNSTPRFGLCSSRSCRGASLKQKPTRGAKGLSTNAGSTSVAFHMLPSSAHTAYPFTADGGRFALLGFPPDAVPVSTTATRSSLRKTPLRTAGLKWSRNLHATGVCRRQKPFPRSTSARITGKR